MKNPTPKQVRAHYARLTRLSNQLSNAMCDAHNAGVIFYENDLYKETSPCSTHHETSMRIERTTERALARAMRTEILDKAGL